MSNVHLRNVERVHLLLFELTKVMKGKFQLHFTSLLSFSFWCGHALVVLNSSIHTFFFVEVITGKNVCAHMCPGFWDKTNFSCSVEKQATRKVHVAINACICVRLMYHLSVLNTGEVGSLVSVLLSWNHLPRHVASYLTPHEGKVSNVGKIQILKKKQFDKTLFPHFRRISHQPETEQMKCNIKQILHFDPNQKVKDSSISLKVANKNVSSTMCILHFRKCCFGYGYQTSSCEWENCKLS